MNMAQWLLISNQFSCMVSVITMNSEAARKTVWHMIRWLNQKPLMKPSDLDVHYCCKEDKAGFSKTKVNIAFNQF